MPPGAQRPVGAGTVYPATAYPGGQPAGAPQYQPAGQQAGPAGGPPRQHGTVYGAGGPSAPDSGAPGRQSGGLAERGHRLPRPPAGQGRPGGRPDPDQSDSFTGHLLGQGEDGPAQRSGTAKVVVILLVVLGLMIVGGLAIAIFAQDWVNDTLGGFLGDG